jgi:hypothetical protein
MSELAPFINKEIQVLTSDGRIILVRVALIIIGDPQGI